MNQENLTKEPDLSLKDYYEAQKQSHLLIRDAICEALNISSETFYRRLKSNTWKDIEKQRISEILAIDLMVLFPIKS